MARKYVYCFNCLWHLMIPPTAPKNSFFVSSYGYFCMTKTCHKLKFKFCALTAPSIALEQQLPSYISYVKFGIAAL